jgi:hypothetical protein
MMIKIAANNAGLLPRWKIIAALSTSITAADILDYLMEPIFTVPLIGDMPDSFFVAALYLITKRADYLQPLFSRASALVGDLSPTYTCGDCWIVPAKRLLLRTNSVIERAVYIYIAFLVLPMCNGRISHYSIRKKSFILWQCI